MSFACYCMVSSSMCIYLICFSVLGLGYLESSFIIVEWLNKWLCISEHAMDYFAFYYYHHAHKKLIFLFLAF